MKAFKRRSVPAAALCAFLAASAASAASNKVVIGDLDDMSGPYADILGAGGIEAIKMAIADFGGTVLGQPIGVLTADHQNKSDIAVQKFREWADTGGLTMQLGGNNSGVNLALSAAAKDKKIPLIAVGPAAASLTGKDCTPYTIHYGYDNNSRPGRQAHGRPCRGRPASNVSLQRHELREKSRVVEQANAP